MGNCGASLQSLPRRSVGVTLCCLRSSASGTARARVAPRQQCRAPGVVAAESFAVWGWELGRAGPRPCPGTGHSSVCNKPSCLGAGRSLVLQLILCPERSRSRKFSSTPTSRSRGVLLCSRRCAALAAIAYRSL